MTKKNILYTKLQENFSDLADFAKRSGLPISFETARRAIYEGKAVSIPSLILICKYLGFTPAEIKKIISDAGDRDFVDLIGDGPQLTAQEKALLEAYRKIKAKEMVADHIELIARAEGVDVSKDVISIKKERK